MSELLEKTVSDLLDRVKKLEGRDTDRALGIMDQALALHSVGLNSLAALIVDKKLATLKEIEESFAKEQAKIDNLIREARGENKETPSETTQQGPEGDSGGAQKES